jgi:hypothetical protein
VAAAGEDVDFTLTDSFGAVSVLDAASSTCDDAGANTDGSGQCTIVFTSNSAGVVTGHASSDVSVGGLSLSRETDGVAPNSGDAVKTFVDAYITIAPDDTNNIGENHTFTVTVFEDDGSGAGFVLAAGENVTVTLTNSGGAVANPAGPFNGVTDGSGEFEVTFTSNSAGQVTGHASSNVSVGGLSLFRETDGVSPNSDDAVKTFIDGSLIWHKVDENGAPLAGATFEVCQTHTLNTATSTYDDIVDVCFSVTDNDATDENPADGEFLVSGLELGSYTVRETAAPAGFTIVNASAVQAPDMTLADPDVEIVEPFVNLPPLEGCTPGWWKNNGLTAWDQPTDPLAQAVAAAVFAKWGTVVEGDSDTFFRDVFDLTIQEMNDAGLDPSLTLLQAVELGGGGFNALARHGVSALLNSLSVAYEFTASSILQDMHDAYADGVFGTDDQALLDGYANANNRDHSSCPTGGDTATGSAGDLILLAVVPATIRRLLKEAKA